VNAGAGVLVRVNSHFSVRGDARYTFSRRGDGAASSIGFGTTYVDFWRLSAGITISLR
jgi:hypothetical protein